MSDESLLDVFVKIGEKGLTETQNAIDEFVEKAKKAFGDLSESQKKSATTAADVQAEAARRAAATVQKAAEESARAQTSSFSKLRLEMLKFQRDKREIEVGVRLVANADISREFANIQSKINEQEKRFQIAPAGREGNSARAAALQQIAALRANDLTLLNEQIEAEITLKGLDTGGEQKAAQLRAVSEEADRLSLALKRINQDVRSSGRTDLREQFVGVNNQVDLLKQNLKTAVSSSDLVGAIRARDQLRQLLPAIERIRASAAQQIPINVDAANLVEGFDLAKREWASLNKLLSFETAGSLDITQKLQVAKLEAMMRDLVITFDRLGKKTNKTKQDLQQMTELVENFGEASVAIQEIKSGLKESDFSTNNLSNNAYQLGQAFEDAAIGFSLNGITGAVRGAANNVNFLINNLAQAGSLSKILGESTARLAPLYLGVGTAALFIIPALYEWWKALKDIEDESIDLAELWKKQFSDVQFRVSLILDARSAAKAILDSKTAIDAVEQLIKQSEEADNLRIKLTLTVEKASASFANKQILDIVAGIRSSLTREAENLQNEILRQRRLLLNAEPGIGEQGSKVEIKRLQDSVGNIVELQKALDSFNESRRKIYEDSAKGLVNPESFLKAEKELQKITKQQEKILRLGSLTPKQIEDATKALAAYNEDLIALRQDAEKWAALTAGAFSEAFEAGQREAQKLARELQFQQDVAAGIADEDERILLTTKEELIEQQKKYDVLRKTYGITKDVERQISQSKKNVAEKQRLEILKKIESLEEKLKRERETASDAAIRAAQNRLDIEDRIRAILEKQEESQIKPLGDISNIVHSVNRDDQNSLVRLQKELVEAQDKEQEELAKSRLSVDRLSEALENLRLRADTIPGFAPEDAVPPAAQGQGVWQGPPNLPGVGPPAWQGPPTPNNEEQAVIDTAEAEFELREKRRQAFEEQKKFQEELKKGQKESQRQAEAAAVKAAAAALEALEAERKITERKEKQAALNKAAEEAAAAAAKAKAENDAARAKMAEERANIVPFDKEKAFKEIEEVKKEIDDWQADLERQGNLLDPNKRAAELAKIAEEEKIIAEENRKGLEQLDAERKAQAEAAERQKREFFQAELERGAQLRREAEALQQTLSGRTDEDVEAIKEKIRRLIEEAQGISREAGAQGMFNTQSRVTPQVSPEDAAAQVRAQAQANSRSMENMNFTSTTLQTLIATSNDLLLRMNENIQRIPGSQGLA